MTVIRTKVKLWPRELSHAFILSKLLTDINTTLKPNQKCRGLIDQIENIRLKVKFGKTTATNGEI